MPTYDYECQACAHRFELFQSMTARVKRKCPECGERSLERLIGKGAGILFKGNGFYATDYRSSSYREAAKAEQSGGSDESAKSAAGSCAPTCGTERAPAGCRAGKKSARRTS